MAVQNHSALLHGVVFEEGGVWVAKCFTIDHAAQARTPIAAIKECISGVLADIRFALAHDTLDYLRPVPLSEQMQLLAASEPFHERRITMPARSHEGRLVYLRGFAEFRRAAEAIR